MTNEEHPENPTEPVPTTALQTPAAPAPRKRRNVGKILAIATVAAGIACVLSATFGAGVQVGSHLHHGHPGGSWGTVEEHHGDKRHGGGDQGPMGEGSHQGGGWGQHQDDDDWGPGSELFIQEWGPDNPPGLGGDMIPGQGGPGFNPGGPRQSAPIAPGPAPMSPAPSHRF